MELNNDVIADELGKDASWGLLFFHALSGCDTVSAVNSMELGRQQHVLFGPVCLLSHFLLGCPVC